MIFAGLELDTNTPYTGAYNTTTAILRLLPHHSNLTLTYTFFSGTEYGLNVDDLNDIPRGPNITEQPQDLIILSRSDSVHVDCGASGNPMPSYRWFRLNGTERTAVTANTNKRYVLTGGRLSIRYPNEENDTGTVQCEATNKLGTVLSNPIRIIFGGKTRRADRGWIAVSYPSDILPGG